MSAGSLRVCARAQRLACPLFCLRIEQPVIDEPE
jgi:hypothetical protein